MAIRRDLMPYSGFFGRKIGRKIGSFALFGKAPVFFQGQADDPFQLWPLTLLKSSAAHFSNAA